MNLDFRPFDSLYPKSCVYTQCVCNLVGYERVSVREGGGGYEVCVCVHVYVRCMFVVRGGCFIIIVIMCLLWICVSDNEMRIKQKEGDTDTKSCERGEERKRKIKI